MYRQEHAPDNLNPEDIYSMSKAKMRRPLPFDIRAQMEKSPECLNQEEIRRTSMLNKPICEPLIKDIQIGKPPEHLNAEDINAIANGKASANKQIGVKTSKIEDTMCKDFLESQEIPDRIFNRKTMSHGVSTFYSP